MEHGSYGYGRGRVSMASVVLVGDKSKMDLKRIEFQNPPSEPFNAAYQWAAPIANYLEIEVKKHICQNHLHCTYLSPALSVLVYKD